jgi:hypothetical protein
MHVSVSVRVAVRMFVGGRCRLLVAAIVRVRVVMIVIMVMIVRRSMFVFMRSGQLAFVMFMLMFLHRTCIP